MGASNCAVGKLRVAGRLVLSMPLHLLPIGEGYGGGVRGADSSEGGEVRVPAANDLARGTFITLGVRSHPVGRLGLGLGLGLGISVPRACRSSCIATPAHLGFNSSLLVYTRLYSISGSPGSVPWSAR